MFSKFFEKEKNILTEIYHRERKDYTLSANDKTIHKLAIAKIVKFLALKVSECLLLDGGLRAR